MILAIDIGNTNIVLGCLDGRNIIREVRMATDPVKTSDQYCLEIKGMLDLMDINVKLIEGVIISSVVPPVLNSFRTAIMKLTGISPLVVGPGIKTGLNILVDTPSQAGSDLVVNALAALAEYEKPVLIFDLSTATTLSVLDSKGSYIGGMIIPGLWTSMNALSAHAAQLPYIDLNGPAKLLGTNTIDCMRSGALIGTAAMLDGLIDRLEEELGESVSPVLTGGVSPLIVPYCRHAFHLEPDILIDGLRILYGKNKTNA